MLAPPSGLLRAGIGLKLSQIKLATRSYLRDRTNQATGTATSYAVAAALFAAAGIFLIAACLVGIAARGHHYTSEAVGGRARRAER